MIDVNATDFVKSFDMKNATVGVVGHGYVGQAVREFFKDHCRVIVYDKVKPELDTLERVVSNAEVIFACVPTPMRDSGQCFTGIVEGVLDEINTEAARVKRNTSSFVVVIKSTVTPGFTEEMQLKHPNMRILFSPEFLTEKNSVNDFKTINRVILGGDEDDALVVFKYFQGVRPTHVEDGRLLLLQCDPTVAEMVKLFTNGILMTKIMFANEIYQMCKKLGTEFEEVRSLACLDSRIGASHTSVPGPDGKIACSGSCFPKDINNLRYVAKELGIDERIFTAVIERNKDLRPEQDWLDLKGRAVLDEGNKQAQE